jgi:thiol-disulfide isomerase/thioredoxin
MGGRTSFIQLAQLCVAGWLLALLQPLSVAHGSAVVELNDSTFDEAIASGTWLINFHAPWCERCKELTPLFERVAAATDKEGVHFGSVLSGKGKLVKSKCKVEKLPSIAYKSAGTDGFGHYHGERSEAGLATLVERLVAPDFAVVDNVKEVQKSAASFFENVSFVLTVPSDEPLGTERQVTEAFMRTARKHKAHANFVVVNKPSSGSNGGGSSSKLSISKMEQGRSSAAAAVQMALMQSTSIEDIDAFVVHNNYPLISTFDNHNYKRLAHLNKVMVLLLVNHLNPKEDDIAIIKTFESTLASAYTAEQLRDLVFGHIDVIKWRKFVKQFQAKPPSVLVVDFRAGADKDKFETFPWPAAQSEEQQAQMLRGVVDAMLEDTIELRPIERVGLLQKLRYRFDEYFPWSALVCIGPVVFILLGHFLAPHPNEFKKKQH